MLGTALSNAWHDVKDIARDLVEREEYKDYFQKVIGYGKLPQGFKESEVDYAVRHTLFNDSLMYYNNRSTRIQHKIMELTLHAVFYDHDISKEVKRIEAEKGYMPKAIIEGIASMIRKRVMDEVKPHIITESDVGKYDKVAGEDFQIHPVLFHESVKDTYWDFSGTDENNTKFFAEDGVRLIILLNTYIDKMKAMADEQERKVKSGEIDAVGREEDYTHIFPLNR